MVYLYVIHMCIYIDTSLCIKNALSVLEYSKRSTVHLYSVKPRLASKMCTEKQKNHTVDKHFIKVFYHRLHRIVFNFKIIIKKQTNLTFIK